MTKTVNLSSLDHTWILDLDGTLVKHNGYKIDGYDTLLDGVKDFLNIIPDGDLIVIITSRTDEYREQTEIFLRGHNIRYDHIIFNAPYGERIVVNDSKPGGLETAIAVNIARDNFVGLTVIRDEDI